MKQMNWNDFIGFTLNVIMNENYGVVHSNDKNDPNFFEIVFKSGKLISAFDNGLLLETNREGHIVKIFIPHSSIKCVEIFNI